MLKWLKGDADSKPADQVWGAQLQEYTLAHLKVWLANEGKWVSKEAVKESSSKGDKKDKGKEKDKKDKKKKKSESPSKR